MRNADNPRIPYPAYLSSVSYLYGLTLALSLGLSMVILQSFNDSKVRLDGLSFFELENMFIPEPPSIRCGAFDGLGRSQPIWCGVFIKVFGWCPCHESMCHFKLHRGHQVSLCQSGSFGRCSGSGSGSTSGD